MSSVTAWTGRMSAHIVRDWAADCSRLMVQRRQRSSLQNCCASDLTTSARVSAISNKNVFWRFNRFECWQTDRLQRTYPLSHAVHQRPCTAPVDYQPTRSPSRELWCPLFLHHSPPPCTSYLHTHHALHDAVQSPLTRTFTARCVRKA